MAEKEKKIRQAGLPVAPTVLGCLALLAMAASLGIISLTKADPRTVIIIAGGAYLVALIIFGVIWLIGRMKNSSKLDVGESIFGTITLAFIQRLHMPVTICDENGRIVWYNNALSTKFGQRGVLYGKYIDNICDSTISRIVKEDKEDGVEVHFNSEVIENATKETYLAKGYEIESRSKRYFMAIFSNITDLKSAYSTIEDSDTVIACAIIDNLDELVQYVQDLYGNATDDVETILRNHMEKIGGVIRDYGHNRFLLLFDAKDLREFEANRFSMLDEVRKIYIGDTTIPVTISMGVAKINGSLLEKERIAQAALDMALQRGGDQVVVKSADDIEYYGGKTKSVQKRTKVRSRVIASEFIMFIENSENVLVMGHKFADFDALAACVAVV
ncbi:MAG: PAS domain-containing protein, partial [Clostridiales bacterium]|nr:PAS domain-containing protein [Clostridiales bacterium]